MAMQLAEDYKRVEEALLLPCRLSLISKEATLFGQRFAVILGGQPRQEKSSATEMIIRKTASTGLISSETIPTKLYHLIRSQTSLTISSAFRKQRKGISWTQSTQPSDSSDVRIYRHLKNDRISRKLGKKAALQK